MKSQRLKETNMEAFLSSLSFGRDALSFIGGLYVFIPALVVLCRPLLIGSDSEVLRILMEEETYREAQTTSLREFLKFLLFFSLFFWFGCLAVSFFGHFLYNLLYNGEIAQAFTSLFLGSVCVAICTLILTRKKEEEGAALDSGG